MLVNMSETILDSNGLNHVINFNKLRTNPIIIDAGAAVGNFIIEIQKEKNINPIIYAIECSKTNIDNFKKNHFNNVILIEKALTNKADDSIFFVEFSGEMKEDGNKRYYQWGNVNGLYEESLKLQKSVQITKYKVNTITL